MKKIPSSVKDHISNTRYYIQAANSLPTRKWNAIRILLLLTARENIKIAEEELSAWAQKTLPTKKLYRDHAYKLRDVRKSKSIDRIILGSLGTPARTFSYSSGVQLAELLKICRYGHKTGTKKLESIFEQGWHSEDFQRALEIKMDWENMMVDIYEKLPGYGK